MQTSPVLPRVLGLVLGVGLGLSPFALAAPQDSFSSGPTRDFSSPQGQRFTGDAAVADQTGDATFAVPIEVPPGRQGMQPSLALRYSSSAPLRGGIAAGWSLDLPIVERDPDFTTEVRYRFQGERLVRNLADPMGGEVYRTEVDNSFTRLQRTIAGWTVLTPDGHTRLFNMRDQNRWRLTEDRDAAGNVVRYGYLLSSVAGAVEYYPSYIEYTANDAAGLVPHAKVTFDYAPLELCGGAPVGAALDHHFGTPRWSGSRRLIEIKTTVRDAPSASWRTAKSVRLGYDSTQLACVVSSATPPMRYLTTIDVTGYSNTGIASSLPTMRFGYGDPQRTLGRTITVAGLPREWGNIDGTKAGFIDLDGDGRNDYVEALTGARCQLRVRRGLPDGQFSSAPYVIDMPTAAWGSSPWGSAPTNQPAEHCTLGGQFAMRAGGLLPNRATCRLEGVKVNYQFVDYDGDGRRDLLTQISGIPSLAGGDFGVPNAREATDQAPTSCPPGTIEGGSETVGNVTVHHCACPSGSGFEPSRNTCVNLPVNCGFGQEPDMLGGCWNTTPGTDPGGGGGHPDPGPGCDGPRDRAEGVWRLQRNTGGQFAPLSEAQLIQAPVVLPESASLLASEWEFSQALPVLVDIDGDGRLDGVSQSLVPDIVSKSTKRLGRDPVWVWRGQPDGTFAAPVKWAFITPTVPTLDGLGAASPTGARPVLIDSNTEFAFIDVDQDQLPDLLFRSNHALYVSYNMAGADVTGAAGAFSTPVEIKTPVAFAFDAPLEQARLELMHEYYSASQWLDGARAQTRRVVDLDGDGLPELAWLPTSTAGVRNLANSRYAYRLVPGGTAMSSVFVLGTEWEGLESQVSASSGTWRRINDFIDLTGDGLADAVYYSGTPRDQLATILTDLAPTAARLLVSADNGRGGVTRFEYALANDDTVVTANGAATAPRRVVKRMTVEPGNGQPSMTTSYAYREPVTAPSGPGRTPGFLGYRAITMDSSGQSGTASQRTITSYDYTALGNDWGGRILTRATFLSRNGAWVPLDHDRNTWAFGALAGNATMTYLTRREHRVCSDGATAEACAAQADALVTNHEYVAWPSPTAPALYTEQVTRTAAPSELERYNRSTFEVRYTATTTRVLPTMTEQGWLLAQSPPWYVPQAHAEATYDSRGFPTERRVAQTSTRTAVTRTVYDDVGQLVQTKRPVQVAAGSALVATTAYDTFRIHAAVTTDEGGRRIWTKTDLATGQPLEIQGPDGRPACGGCFNLVYETQRFSRDGFGRVTTHERSIDPAPGQPGYAQRLDTVTYYYDNERPARVQTYRLKDPVSGAWTLDEATVDGLGRTTSTTARRQIAGGVDAVTSYRYDAGGRVHVIDAPDPRFDDNHRVFTTLTRDGAGRVISMIRPDGTHDDITYRGLQTEIAKVGATRTARTVEYKTLLGELVQVHELDNPAPGDRAITRYIRDALGRAIQVIDADGDNSSISYDLGGHRTGVTHGARTWTFEYDLDGNSIAVTEPVPTGASPTDYRTTTQFDALDRATVTTYATRGMSAARRAELGIGNVVISYRPLTDQVARVDLPFGAVTYTYDPSGNVARELRTVRAPTMPAAVTQYVDRTYDLLGNIKTVLWDDGVGFSYSTDARGAISTAGWRNTGMAAGAYETLATYTRGILGQVRTRSGLGQQRDLTFDIMGRITYDRVWRPGIPGSLSEQSVYYDDLGNVATTSATTGGLVEDSAFTYDAVDRLTGVLGAAGYESQLEYSAAGNLRSARLHGTDADRDVEYHYGAVDAQAVDWLADRASGATVGSFAYDSSGNMTQRRTDAGTATLTWDANGILRETADGNSVSRVFVGPNAERMIGVDSTGTTLWFGDSETLLGLNGAAVRRYHHLAAGEPVARIENASIVELQYADALQNLRLATTRTGAVAAAFTYGAFGEVLSSIGADKHARQFNGKDSERVAGLRSYGYRSYDPLTLRWASADPVASVAPDLGVPQLANRYSFSANNPVRYLDPDGLTPGTFPWLGDLITAPPPAPTAPAAPAPRTPRYKPLRLVTGDEKTGGGFDPEEVADKLYPHGSSMWRQVVGYLEAFQLGTLPPTLEIKFSPFATGTSQGFTWPTYVETDEYAVEIVPYSSSSQEVAGKLTAGATLLDTNSESWQGSIKATGTVGKKDVASLSGEGSSTWGDSSSRAVGRSTGFERPSVRMYSHVVGELRLTLKRVDGREQFPALSVTLAPVARITTMSTLEVDDDR